MESEYLRNNDTLELQDLVLLSQAILGIRAFLDPSTYDINHPTIVRAIGIAETFGFIQGSEVILDPDVWSIIYPKNLPD